MWSWFINFWLDPEFYRKKQFLQKISLFKDVPRREFGRLFQALTVRHYAEGELLFKEGDVGRALFILEAGQVEVFRQISGRPQRVAVLGSGGYLGEMSLLDDLPRTASARALTVCRVYLLYKTELDALMSQAPHLAAAIMAHLAELLAGRLRLQMTQVQGSSGVVQPFIEEVL
jgi:CRP/FNR family transcriptional regulator, cyclic AMP receptor protein